MAYKPKTRFWVETQHGVRELFSVREIKDGDLKILLRPGRNFEDPDKGNVEIVSEKFSIHPSLKSDGTTIKRENPLTDGRPLTSVAFVSPSKTNLLFPVFGQYLPRLEPDHYNPTNNARDRTISIGRYNDDRATMVMSLFVSSIDRSPPPYPDSAGSMCNVDFSRFRLTIYSAYMNVPALNGHNICYAPTSPQQDIPNPVRPLTGGSPPFSDRAAQSFVDMVASQSRKLYLERLHNILGKQITTEMALGAKQGSGLILRIPFEDLEKRNDQLPVIFSSSLPLCDGAKGVIVSVEGEPIGKIFLD